MAIAAVCVFVAPASAQTSRGSPWTPERAVAADPGPEADGANPGNGPVMAGFEGRRIDLSTNWEQAQACIVLRHSGIVECFRSFGQAQARADTITPEAAASSLSCSYPLRIYEHSNYGGRLLMFFDRGYWQNLPDYGFNDQLSSYIVGACYTYLAEHVGGGGAFYPGPRTAWAGVPWLQAGWDNRVSSIYMA